MKRIILIGALALVLASGVAFAKEDHEHGHDHGKVIIVKGKPGPAGANGINGTNGVDGKDGVNAQNPKPNTFGAKLDMPKLVQLTENWYVGTEGGKDLNYTNVDEGWFAYAKVTYTGTLFSFKK
jgi:hypothetical protein